MTKDSLIQQAFEVAAERYAAVGVDVRTYKANNSFHFYLLFLNL